MKEIFVKEVKANPNLFLYNNMFVSLFKRVSFITNSSIYYSSFENLLRFGEMFFPNLSLVSKINGWKFFQTLGT
jgi:hypothetical protein